MANRSFPDEFEGSVCGPFFWDNRELWEVLEQELARGPNLACHLFLFCFVCFIFAFLVCFVVLLRMFLHVSMVREKNRKYILGVF